MSASLFLLGLVVFTSLLAALAGVRWARLQRGAFRLGLLRTLECVGLAVGFYVLNVAAGFVMVLFVRRLTGSFVSLYVNTDATLTMLSVLQAITFQWWRAESNEAGPPPG